MGSEMCIRDRSLLDEYSEGIRSELFVSYSVRRGLPTLADVVEASDNDKLAIGDWQEMKGKNPLPVRYSAERQRTAEVAKLRLILLAQAAAMVKPDVPLSWAEIALG